MYNKNYNGGDNDYGKKTIDPYNRRRFFDENETRKNNNDFISPLKISSKMLMNQNNNERFQNENLTVDRVSPVHYQYKTKIYDDGGYPTDNYTNNRFNAQQNYNRDNNYHNSSNYVNTEFNNNNMQYKNNAQLQHFRGNSDNRRYNTPDNYNKNIYNTEANNEMNRLQQMRRKNSDLDVENGKYYLKNPCDYYRGEEIDDGFRHYNPEDNNYSGSRYGGYIYNYYLNAPMRGDKSEDWRFPPLYYYRPKYDSKRKIYTNYH